MESVFDEVIREMLMSAKFFLYIVKTCFMVYIITKFRYSSSSYSEIKVGGGEGRSFAPIHPKIKSKKPPRTWLNTFKPRYKSSHWRCFTKKVFLKISQYSQDIQCFPVNIAKFSRTLFLHNTFRRLFVPLSDR